MSLFAIFALLMTITALFSFLNERWFKLPTTIGVMVASLLASIILIILSRLGLNASGWAFSILQRIDFNALLMKGMLSFLLFAGALHLDLDSLLDRRWSILTLATVGVLISTFMIGTASWLIFNAIGLEVPFVYALLFGALISPTDPIAVLGLLKRAKMPGTLETMITGESLFNDGVGVVVFTLVLGFIAGGHEMSLWETGKLFFVEAIGGVIYGILLGLLGYLFLKSVDNYKVEALLSLALVTGGYALAGFLHTSGPIAMVVAGLFIGNRGRAFAMSDKTRERLDDFWELMDEILNALLFVMIGLEVLVLDLMRPYFVAGFLLIPTVLISRFFSVGIPLSLLRYYKAPPPYTIRIMTWGGLRGGVSIALALSLPLSPQRGLILMSTYIIVIFAILVQGLTFGRLARWVSAKIPSV
ncbi:MAG: sodium:proton antiporter [Candidatus Eisenbacteria bacterium]|uniref:Sodium:proton antiporter n=1 Tax=Eiseniibacteriota bacterium TaxID=2212470 RepID=A0A948RV05_UNCEI|nr:sodium:proton antiporter [Candidatus Eisenbacteria bacterium]MBU1948734.1 sodium:proton antiporter [Candidatus Eisenbacteria bacterium]MBU2690481.1 sodium:proton antiporter [Candidatus Eisenbacteria bacterium]